NVSGVQTCALPIFVGPNISITGTCISIHQPFVDGIRNNLSASHVKRLVNKLVYSHMCSNNLESFHTPYVQPLRSSESHSDLYLKKFHHHLIPYDQNAYELSL